jgi:4-hydroxy 2-oxovalerate aldolase
MEAAKNFYIGEPRGTWSPVEFFDSRDILLLGTGPGVQAYRDALECFINNHKPFVIALNTQTVIDSSLIDARIACHPVRLLADCEEHTRLPQPLITPFSMLPEDVKKSLKNKTIYDYGISVKPETFEYHKEYCIAPSSLVIAYSLAVANSGGAKRIYLAGFDGYGSDDLRNHENNNLFKLYKSNPGSCELISITPTSYELDVLSVHAMLINGVFL